MTYKTFIQNAREEYSEQLIEAISQLFLERGIEPMRMTDIAKELGLGVATLYRYYKTKKVLVLRCAAHIWEVQQQHFASLIDTEEFHSKTGLEQIETLLGSFLILYREHQPFLEFLKNFDIFIAQEHLTPEELADYDKDVLNVYPYLFQAYEKGLKDGSVRPVDNFQDFYFTTNHALMSLAQKALPSGHLLTSDNLVSGESQLNLMIRMACEYLQGGYKK